MTNKYKVVDANTIDSSREDLKRSPMDAIWDRVDGDYWRMRDMAKHVGVHIETVRRACAGRDINGKPLLNAPSKAVQAGRVVIWAFTKDDVLEVENFFISRGIDIGGRIDPTKTLKEQIPA